MPSEKIILDFNVPVTSPSKAGQLDKDANMGDINTASAVINNTGPEHNGTGTSLELQDALIHHHCNTSDEGCTDSDDMPSTSTFCGTKSKRRIENETSLIFTRGEWMAEPKPTLATMDDKLVSMLKSARSRHPKRHLDQDDAECHSAKRARLSDDLAHHVPTHVTAYHYDPYDTEGIPDDIDADVNDLVGPDPDGSLTHPWADIPGLLEALDEEDNWEFACIHDNTTASISRLAEAWEREWEGIDTEEESSTEVGESDCEAL
ncbi:hypothetical protein F4677DRAFT_357273 [Hypoxylon crocopeplum]|nr:hypothetical protein F4677DRAFT_357273 [Hypoxylon crocopeplum]